MCDTVMLGTLTNIHAHHFSFHNICMYALNGRNLMINMVYRIIQWHYFHTILSMSPQQANIAGVAIQTHHWR